MGVTVVLFVVAGTVVTTLVLLVMALAVPPEADPRAGSGTHDVAQHHPAFDERDPRPRLRLLSRLLFTRTRRDAITLDCLLLSVEQAGPGVAAPEGLPFTLELRTPDTGWFAARVDDLLHEWADESRELVLELREDHGKVRTMITSEGSSVHLELSGAAGLTLTHNS
jgi:hypothetical protein